MWARGHNRASATGPATFEPDYAAPGIRYLGPAYAKRTFLEQTKEVAVRVQFPNSGRRPIRFTVFEGEEVAILSLPDGTPAMMSAGTARELLQFGYPLGSCRLRDNGKGDLYVSLSAWLPPKWPEAPSYAPVQSLARLIYAHVRDHLGINLAAKGWISRTPNGPCDLRDSVVGATAAEGWRNGWESVQGLRERKRLHARGCDPHAEFARGWRERKKREKARAGARIIGRPPEPGNKDTINQPPVPHRGAEEVPGGTRPAKPRGRGR